MNEHVPFLQKLQSLRKAVPMYVFITGITPHAWIKVKQNLHLAPDTDEIDVVLNSSGGSAEDAYRMIRTFREKYYTVNVIVPFWAKSAATLFAFGANRLVLHECGELGPIDAQIPKDDERDPEAWSSALDVQSSVAEIEKRSREGMLEMFTLMRGGENSEIVRIGRKALAEMLLDYSAKFYAPLLQKIEPMEMGQRARVLNVGKMYARRILKQYNSTTTDKQIEELLYFLVYECPDHGYVVDHQILRSFLPFVLKADQAPFGLEYYKTLGSLALFLMEKEWPNINDFLSSFAPQTTPSTMEVPVPPVAGEQNE